VLFSPELILSIHDGLPEHAKTLKAVRERGIFKLFDVTRLPRIPWQLGGHDDNPPLLDSVLWIWTVAFSLNITAQVNKCDGRLWIDRLLTDAVFELQDGKGKFAGRFLYQRADKSIAFDSVAILAVSVWDEEQPYSSNLGERLGFSKFKSDYDSTDWSTGVESKVIQYFDQATGERHLGLPSSIFPTPEERREARFFNVLVVQWQQNGIAERVGIGMVLETGIRDALRQGPLWREVLLG